MLKDPIRYNERMTLSEPWRHRGYLPFPFGNQRRKDVNCTRDDVVISAGLQYNM
jgi:hypothetical protein